MQLQWSIGDRVDRASATEAVDSGSIPGRVKSKTIVSTLSLSPMILVSNTWTNSGGGTIRPLPRDGDKEELYGDPTVRPHPKVWTIGQE